MSSSMLMDRARLFRNALGSFATGVTVVTTLGADGSDVGMTANSFNSVSLDPPMILWSLAKTSTCFAAFMQAEYFAVHILSVEQEGLSGRFARSGIEKFAGLALERGEGGVPMLPGCAARFQCRAAYRHEGGDHIIVVGEVAQFDHDGRAPLAFHGGRYGMFVRNEPPIPAPVEEAAEPALISELLVQAEDALLREVEEKMGEAGVSLAEFEVLRSLNDLSLTLEELEDRAGPGGEISTVVLVQGLAERGIVDAPEGRVVTLTDAGRAALDEAAREIGRIEDAALSGFSREERRLLRRFLERLAEPGEA